MPMHSLLLVGAARHPDKVFQCLMVPIGIETPNDMPDKAPASLTRRDNAAKTAARTARSPVALSKSCRSVSWERRQ
jgi:hypothetical protein